jgi:hypothetical protein
MTRTKGVGFYGKVRIPTIGHREAIKTARKLAGDAELNIGLSGTSHPLSPEQKRRFAELMFDHPVMPAGKHTQNIISFLSHMSSKHDDFTLVAGSDRAKEYHAILKQYNGKPDKTGKVPFNFRRWRVHQVEGNRVESNKDPRKMSREELRQSVSATKLEKLAREGNWEHFKAYHPGIPATHVKKIFDSIRGSLREEIEVPPIGMTLSRDLMPQIDKEKSFLDYLKKKGITSQPKTIPTKELKSSQSEFDINKIAEIMLGDNDKKILVSNDGHVLDGHHRWIADHNTDGKTDAHVINLPILELIRIAKEYTGTLKEDCDWINTLNRFIEFAERFLKIENPPDIDTIPEGDKSFGGYQPSNHVIKLVTKNRHPMDVFRTLAHELVHHKQNEEGRITDAAKEGATGSDIENEANAVAGQIMRHWAKENPHHFQLSALTENVAVFVVGGPCSGKDKIIKTLKEDIPHEMDILSLAKAKSIHKQIIINGSANELNEILTAKKLLENNNYHTSLIFVDTSNEISKLRNEERQARGQRMISENIRFSKYVTSQDNKEKLKEQFGEDMTIKDNSLDERFSAFLKEEGKEQKSKPKDREEGTDSLRKIYQATTPGQKNPQNWIDVPDPYVGGVGVGPTAAGSAKPYGLAESIRNWMNNPKTQARFTAKYGDLAEKKLFEAAYNLNKSLKEATDKGALDRRGTVPDQGMGNDAMGEDGPFKRKPKSKKV